MHSLPLRTVTTVLGIAALVAAFVVAPSTGAQAANAADFDPGFLVSDADFFNGSALTAAQADAFIAGMNKGCATGKTCIKNYREDVTAKAATTRCKAITAATKRTAGQIITTVAKACGISPKAILVILQKEQSLVTSTAPSSRAFAYAMGAGCPDSTGCTTPYQGLYAQVYYGASLLKGYTLPSSSLYARYQVGKTSAIKYHPSTACGTKSVYVKNLATHALYVYTPYTPNAAALKYLTGSVPSTASGASCASYGNRNFWRIYTDWWGPTGSAGALAVDALYTKLGGESGALGPRTGTIATTTAKGAGLYQTYENGTIAWNLKNGAHVISGDLAATWQARISEFGWPTQDSVASSAAGSGTYQNFDSVLLAQKSGGKVYTVWSSTRTQYLAAKGPGGAMGWPSGYQAKDASGLYSQVFTGGTAYRSGTKTGFVRAALVAGFVKRGGVTGTLGWPKNLGTVTSLRGGGTWQTFDKGALFQSTLGTQAVYGTTFTKFTALGGIATAGWPLKSRVAVDTSGWRQQEFEKGTIFVKGSTSAYVATEFAPTWISTGFTTGNLGAPTSKPIVTSANGGGIYQGFAKAMLTQKTGGKIYRLTGQVRTAWTTNSHASGVLGWPTSKATKDAKLGVTVQKFEKGVVIATSKKHGIIGANQWAVAKAHGVGGGSLGWPTATVKKSSVGAGGEYQYFTAGTITWQQDRGAFFVPKAIWAARTTVGGLAGLGWPTAAATWDAKKSAWTQKFEFASITCVTGKACTVKSTR